MEYVRAERITFSAGERFTRECSASDCKIMKKITLLIVALLFAQAVFAEIKMPKIFSDNMVLQRGEQVRVWGKASPDADVRVEFAGKNVSAKADKDGKWSLFLPPLETSAQAREMLVFENGAVSKKIGGILVGEVWITGGQSNMQFGANSMIGSKEELENLPKNLRYFAQDSGKISETPLSDFAGWAQWLVAGKDKLGNSNAIALFFGSRISKALGDIPVGIVESSRGGTRMVGWTPIEFFNSDPLMEPARKMFDRDSKKWKDSEFEKMSAKWRAARDKYEAEVAKAKAAGKRAPICPWAANMQAKPDISKPYGVNNPARLWNAKIAPMAGFTARGFLWYQGESDYMWSGFKSIFEGMKKAWRKAWEKPDMYFLCVQLPSYKDNGWEYMRWDQMRASLEDPNGGIAVSIDTGDKDDVHPRDKKPIIDRLANIALNDVYGQKKPAVYGPIFKSAKYSADTAELTFDLRGRKLECRGEPRGFIAKCADGQWRGAKAEFSDGKLTVKTPDGSAIKGVRYLWKGWVKPDVCLYNDAGIPAFGFTDEKR